MTVRYCWITGLMMSLAIAPSWAATVIKHQGGKQNKEQVVAIEGDKARMENGMEGSYSLIDLATQKIFMVDERNHRVIKMGVGEELPPLPESPRNAAKKPAEVDAKLAKIGEGPKILDYPTVHYQLVANDVVCSDEYFSEAATQVTGLQKFINTLAAISQDRKEKMAQMPSPLRMRDPCMQAREKLEEDSAKLGVPMRSVDSKGRVLTEVISIEKDVKMSAEKFELPKDFKVMTEKELIQAFEAEARQQMRDPRLEQ